MKPAIIIAFIMALLPAQIQAQSLPIPTFTSPEHIVEINDAWQKQSIQYESGIEADIVLSLDQQLYDTLLPLINRYAYEHHLKIATNKGTCGISAGHINKKRVDIGGFCCPAGKNDRLPGLKWHTLGIAPIHLIVHPTNSTQSISLQQARDIFAGNIYDWKQVSGKKFSGLIHPIGRLHCKHRPGHWRLLLGNEDDFSPDLMEVGAIPDMVRTVAADKFAIGYETNLMIEAYKSNGGVHSLAIDGIRPEQLQSNRYPLYRTYNLTSWSKEHLKNEHADKLIEYLLQQASSLNPDFQLVPAAKLRRQGWHFHEDELIGEPDNWR
ncbi:phosphate-binding protein PstS 1 precursor [Mariprofundus micogutta]|uniref:Phosphate-binding protein PstS 1 n=1 Tax=Mariprofundus micogutta TaxID=1921010 RepID=A0A1L8CJZ9_9PROT|nr:hypothetical protein [Mariprofundus micogutta]GAV19220.1 phosphate-binding protein PstS 1 precursor [Mariprofundus micogutta]